jgi:hypothetical protein
VGHVSGGSGPEVWGCAAGATGAIEGNGTPTVASGRNVFGSIAGATGDGRGTPTVASGRNVFGSTAGATGVTPGNVDAGGELAGGTWHAASAAAAPTNATSAALRTSMLTVCTRT